MNHAEVHLNLNNIMRIAIITGRFPTTSETFILNHARELLARGIDVQVICRGKIDRTLLEQVGFPSSKVEELGNNSAAYDKVITTAAAFLRGIVRYPYSTLRSISPWVTSEQVLTGYLLRQSDQVRQLLPFDLIHCHFGPHGVFGSDLIKVGLESSLVVTFHGFDVNLNQIDRPGYARLFRSNALYTANSQFTADRAIAIGCPASALRRWRIGVDVHKFPFIERIPSADKLKILSIGRLTPKKGFQILIPAFAQVKPPPQGLELHIVGGGSQEALGSLKDLANQYSVQDNVYFHGSANEAEVRHYFSLCQLFALACVTGPDGDKEGQGLVIQEAQASGLPVITTRHNGVPEGLCPEQHELLANEGDIDSLRISLQRAVDEPEKWRDWGHAGRAFVEKYYSFERTTDDLLTIYNELLG
ncbi:MAG: glycosyltransferase [Aphanocapsa sp. GSE-SYN-MK-11-07L]|nr:glycosyltransferase [Aphanocapsa sp. GSE-SYN-MK-11-07L]